MVLPLIEILPTMTILVKNQAPCSPTSDDIILQKNQLFYILKRKQAVASGLPAADQLQKPWGGWLSAYGQTTVGDGKFFSHSRHKQSGVHRHRMIFADAHQPATSCLESGVFLPDWHFGGIW
jgi:hypothetical protein